MTKFDQSYLGGLRKLVGHRLLITPGVRAIIQDQHSRTLFVRRFDNGNWVLPAGGLELGESILDCLTREVKEETGLDVISATPIAVYSESRFAFVNYFGDQQQMLDLVFFVDKWSGSLTTSTSETTDAKFFGDDDILKVDSIFRETLSDLAQFNGRLIVK